MPTYQYACTSPECANRFELVQAFTDPAVSQCPVCAHPVRKVYGSVGVVFKGSGFYRTDSRSEKGRKSGASDADAPKKDGSAAKKDGAAPTSSTPSTSPPTSDRAKSPVPAATS
jgi:putative FmdB family regulatory protein